MSDNTKQEDTKPEETKQEVVLKSPLDEKQEGEENVLADAQKVVNKLDELQPKSVEDQEKESQQNSPVGQDVEKKDE